jgi:hypothetical protein
VPVPLDPLTELAGAGLVRVGWTGGGEEAVEVVVGGGEAEVAVFAAAGCEAAWCEAAWCTTRRCWTTWRWTRAGCLSAVIPGTNCAARAASVVVADAARLWVVVAALADP